MYRREECMDRRRSAWIGGGGVEECMDRCEEECI
jgi:hypothetical protein